MLLLVLALIYGFIFCFLLGVKGIILLFLWAASIVAIIAAYMYLPIDNISSGRGKRLSAVDSYIYNSNNKEHLKNWFTKDGHPAIYSTEDDPNDPELLYIFRKSKRTGKYYYYWKDTTTPELAFKKTKYGYKLVPYDPAHEDEYV